MSRVIDIIGITIIVLLCCGFFFGSVAIEIARRIMEWINGGE